mgnify:CR=1 FL=1
MIIKTGLGQDSHQFEKTSGKDLKKDGQPDPLSYLDVDSKSFISQFAQ